MRRAASFVRVKGAVTLKVKGRSRKRALVSMAARGMAPPALLTSDVDPPELLGRRLHQALELIELGHVGGHDERPAAQGPDPCRHLVEVRLGPRRQDDVGPGLGQPDGDPPPDAEPGAGDDGHPAVEPETIEDHARRLRPQGRRRPSRHQRHLQVGQQAGVGGTHVGHGVDAVHGGGHDAGIALEAGSRSRRGEASRR